MEPATQNSLKSAGASFTTASHRTFSTLNIWTANIRQGYGLGDLENIRWGSELYVLRPIRLTQHWLHMKYYLLIYLSQPQLSIHLNVVGGTVFSSCAQPEAMVPSGPQLNAIVPSDSFSRRPSHHYCLKVSWISNGPAVLFFDFFFSWGELQTNGDKQLASKLSWI